MVDSQPSNLLHQSPEAHLPKDNGTRKMLIKPEELAPTARIPEKTHVTILCGILRCKAGEYNVQFFRMIERRSVELDARRNLYKTLMEMKLAKIV